MVAGQNQIVVFSGFKPGEQVNLTLFSRETALPPVTASAAGVAQAEFTVPADTVAGTHRLEAIGQTSGTVGVASFQVTAPPPVTLGQPDAQPHPVTDPEPQRVQQRAGQQFGARLADRGDQQRGDAVRRARTPAACGGCGCSSRSW